MMTEVHECHVKDNMDHDSIYYVPDGTPGFPGASIFYQYPIPNGIMTEVHECPVRDNMDHDSIYCVPDGTPGFPGASIFYQYPIPNGIMTEVHECPVRDKMLVERTKTNTLQCPVRDIIPLFRYSVIPLLLLLLCMSCTQKSYYEDSGTIFNTLYSIKYESTGLLSDKINKEFQDFSLSMNPFNPNSIISKVNRNEDVDVDDMFITVFNKAMEVSEKSDGAFDVTASALINLWGFGFEQNDSLSQQTIDSLKTFTGYKKIRIEHKKVIKDDPRITLNFSAIAKGYACDVIGELLEREGVGNYMVDIGGEVAAKGKNHKGQCWQIGVNKPEDDVTGMINEIDTIVLLCGKKGLATSGNYRNFYIKDGKKYGHIIDPRTGYPSEQNIISATIIAPDCMTADAYATTFMVIGVEAACQLAETIPEIEYFILYHDDNSFSYQKKYSKSLKPLLRPYINRTIP